MLTLKLLRWMKHFSSINKHQSSSILIANRLRLIYWVISVFYTRNYISIHNWEIYKRALRNVCNYFQEKSWTDIKLMHSTSAHPFCLCLENLFLWMRNFKHLHFARTKTMMKQITKIFWCCSLGWREGNACNLICLTGS